MRLFFLLITLACFSSLSANVESNKGPKTVFYGVHSYICFDDKFYIHDPDCRYDAEWSSITRDGEGNIITITNHIKKIKKHD